MKEKIRRYAEWLKAEHGNCETDEYWKSLAEDTVKQIKENDPEIYESL